MSIEHEGQCIPVVLRLAVSMLIPILSRRELGGCVATKLAGISATSWTLFRGVGRAFHEGATVGTQAPIIEDRAAARGARCLSVKRRLLVG